ncbi:hypothetical protein EG329_003295 [Mollisiaceae sp. DMI_Dod_QoI]|nr:hypothetical protein EG329_003295 [Helotiales sp. DMI_Dod_QoI]
MTSKAHIAHLKDDVSRLWTAVHTLETKLGCVPTKATLQPPTQMGNPGAFHGTPSDDDLDSNASDLSPTSPQSHLLQLFDTGLLGSDGYGPEAPVRPAPNLHKAQESYALRALLPSKEDMVVIAAQASPWLYMYNSLFPTTNIFSSGEEMLSQYDKLQDPNANPFAIADLLLSVAITVQQKPNETVVGIKNASSFIKDVCDTVERIIISHDALAGTLEGIRTSLLFLRIEIGRSGLRKVWILSRRIIALAELIGLPRASMALASYKESLVDGSRNAQTEVSSSVIESRSQKAEVWESICAVDKIMSMMWSLPLATLNYPLPKRPIVDSQGQVNPQAFLYSLTGIATRVIELDHISSSGRPPMEMFNAVISTDQELRSLISSMPKGWRRIDWPELSVHGFLQFWHRYLTVRTHLQLALKYDDGPDFAFNFITCLEACQEMARQYISMRPAFPEGFFANRVIDLQAFTGATFLLLSKFRTSRGSSTFQYTVDLNIVTGLVDQVVQMMEFVATRAGGDFARQAVDAIRSLNSLLQQPQTTESQKITLSLGLAGRIHVSRKSNVAKNIPQQTYPAPGQQPSGWENSYNDAHSAPQVMSMRSSDINFMDSLSYSMEISDDYPFFDDETFGNEQWLTWTDGTV